MNHSTYRLKDGLIGMPLEGHLMLIDELLDADMSPPEERRDLLMDHELLAATAEFFARYSALVEDEDGCSYVPLPRRKRAYDLDQFVEFVQEDEEHLQRLTSLVRDALFARFMEDAAAAA